MALRAVRPDALQRLVDDGSQPACREVSRDYLEVRGLPRSSGGRVEVPTVEPERRLGAAVTQDALVVRLPRLDFNVVPLALRAVAAPAAQRAELDAHARPPPRIAS